MLFMSLNALDRLKTSETQETLSYSVEEQMESADEDDFLESMSDSSREALLKSVQPSIQEVVLEKSTETKTDDTDEALFNNKENKKKRGRQPKTTTPPQSPPTQNLDYDPIMNKLALNLISDLQVKKFKLNGFDDNLMKILYDYIQTKFI